MPGTELLKLSYSPEIGQCRKLRMTIRALTSISVRPGDVEQAKLPVPQVWSGLLGPLLTVAHVFLQRQGSALCLDRSIAVLRR